MNLLVASLIQIHYSCSSTPIRGSVRIINHVGYYGNTKLLFVKSKILKFVDFVQFKTAQFMFKVKKKSILNRLQRMFKHRGNIQCSA